MHSTIADVLKRSSQEYLHALDALSQTLEQTAGDAQDIAHLLRTLIAAEGATTRFGINEVNVQCAGAESSEMALLRLLNSDSGSVQKVKVPFLGTVATVPPSVSSQETLSALRSPRPVSASPVPAVSMYPQDIPTVTQPLKCLVDYWLPESDNKQVTIKSKDLLTGMILQRLPESEARSETMFRLEVGSQLAALSNKRRKAFSGKYLLSDLGSDESNENEWFACEVSKLMVTFDEVCDVWVDGICFEDVSFMNVSSKYYSRIRYFPVFVPFAQASAPFCVYFYHMLIPFYWCHQTIPTNTSTDRVNRSASCSADGRRFASASASP